MNTITEVYQKYHYILDPHAAVAFASLEQYLEENPGKKGLFWEPHIR
jgi:threonine synthase